MSPLIACLAVLAVAYLLGSIPTGYLAGRLFQGVDIRQLGSGSTGATNALRTLGVGPAVIVIVVDILKGAAAVLFAGWLFTWLTRQASGGLAAMAWAAWVPWAICLAGLGALIGHARSIWLGFTGGKSAAAGLGVLLAMSWPVGMGVAAAFILTVALSRIVSLGSMLAALTAMAMICALPHPLAYRLLVIAGGAYVIVLHRANIVRLLAGVEPRLGQTAPDAKA